MPNSQPTVERDRRELAFRLALGPALLAARGYASDEVERNYDDAARLAGSLSDREAAFTSTRGLWHYFYDKGELDRALDFAERLTAIASQESNSEKKGLALRALGSTLMNKAEFVRAIEVFERCIAECGDAALGANLTRHGEEPQIVALQYKGMSLTVQGFADSGLAATEAALSLAKRMNFPLMVAFASTIVGTVRILRREHILCAALVKEQIAFCADHGLVFWSAAHEILHGAALACGDGDPAGVAQLQAGIEAWRMTGAGLHIPTWSSFLVEAALSVGDLAGAEVALTDGLKTANRHGDVFALAELHRLAGHLHMRRNHSEEAGRAFTEAVRVARRQGAGTYLLRAGRDLAQFLGHSGHAVKALEMLTPIVAGVREHRDGLDFQEASALRSTLSS